MVIEGIYRRKQAQLVMNNNNKEESLYWMKHFSFRLDVVNVCPVCALTVSSEYSFTDRERMDKDGQLSKLLACG